MGCHALLQGIFLTQGLNPLLLWLLHYRRILYSCHRESPGRWPYVKVKTPVNTALEIGDLGLLKTIHLELDWPVVVVQSLSRVQLFVTPWTTLCQALSFPSSRRLLRFMSIVLVLLCNHLILCCPLLLLPSIFPSIRVFSSHLMARELELQLHHQSLQ